MNNQVLGDPDIARKSCTLTSEKFRSMPNLWWLFEFFNPSLYDDIDQVNH